MKDRLSYAFCYKMNAFCSRKRNLNEEIYCAKIGHTKLGLQVILLETCVLEDTSRRIENLKSTKFLRSCSFNK